MDIRTFLLEGSFWEADQNLSIEDILFLDGPEVLSVVAVPISSGEKDALRGVPLDGIASNEAFINMLRVTAPKTTREKL